MNAHDAWLATLGQLQVQLNRATYNTWLGQARYVAYEDGRLVISVPHAYAKDWLEKHLVSALADTFGGLLKRTAEVQVIVWDPTEDETDVRTIFNLPSEPAHACDSTLLDRTKTLDNLTPNPTNHDALLFVRFVLESKLGEHPSLFMAGAPGTGKTHLLQAIANNMIDQAHKVVFVNAEQFTSEMIGAIRGGAMEQFRDKYRTCDVLIMDEVEFLEGKDNTQVELRHIWDTLSRRRCLMVFASRRLPRDLSINRDLRSCFNRWLLCEIGPLEAESCAAIVQTKARQLGVELPADVRDTLAERIGGDPAMIEGAITQMSNYARITRRPLSVAMVDTLFHARESSPTARAIDVYQVMQATAAHFNLDATDLTGKRRTKDVNTARQLAMHLARSLTDASLAQIGIAFGGRDHSTVLHGIAKIVESMKGDPALRAAADAIRQRLLSPALVRPPPKPASGFRAFTIDDPGDLITIPARENHGQARLPALINQAVRTGPTDG